MHTLIQGVVTSLESLSSAIMSGFADDRPFIELWGWNCPALNRTDLASIPLALASRLKQASLDSLEGLPEERITRIPQQLATLQGNTVPQLYGGNCGAACSAIIATIDSIECLFGPIFAWQHPDPKTLPANLTRKLRSINAELDELLPNKDRLALQIEQINLATEAAENLPIDLQDLDNAKKKVAKNASDAEMLFGKLQERDTQSKEILDSLNGCDKEAAQLVGNCEEAYRITTTKGLAGAFQDRATRLGSSVSVWVGLLLFALGAGAYMGYHRIEIITKALSAPSPRIEVLWLQFALSALSVGAPLWFAWLATKQIGQRFRLAEDYAFKASVAKAYEGYRREAARLDPAFEARLFASALDRLDEAPLRMVEHASHGGPIAELLASGTVSRALDAYPAYKERILDACKEAVSKFQGKGTIAPPSATAADKIVK